MEVITIQHPHDFKREEMPPIVMALGYFDGVHLGHQKVIETTKEVAEKLHAKTAVMTFNPHPTVVLRHVKNIKYITPLEEKVRLISQLQIDYLFVVHFTQDFANLTPQQFVDQYIIGLNAIHVVAGFDYTYGRMGQGTMETLKFHSREKFDYTVVQKLTLNNEKISSTLIRSHIVKGNFELLPQLLGRFYTTAGIIVHGDKRGRTIGFPTANVEVEDEYMLPPLGVYSVKFYVKGKWYEGVCNVGYKPTFKDDKDIKPSVEVHVLHFKGDIYGEEAIIEWHKHLRPEIKFSSAHELIEQIEKDKQSTIAYFEKMNG